MLEFSQTKQGGIMKHIDRFLFGGTYKVAHIDIITTKPGAEVVDYSTESTKELKAEESNFQP